MILTFGDEGTEDIYHGRDSRKARKACPVELWWKAQMKLQLIRSAKLLHDLKAPPGNRLEAPTGDRKGQHSIRINDKYRVCFRWTDMGAEHVEIVRGKRGVTPDTACRLGKLFGTTPDFWLNMQQDWDLWHTLNNPDLVHVVEEIDPVEPAAA